MSKIWYKDTNPNIIKLGQESISFDKRDTSEYPDWIKKYLSNIDTNYETDLITMFSQDGSIISAQTEFNKLDSMAKELISHGVSKENIYRIINSIWPIFGIYVFKLFKQLTIMELSSYNLEKLNDKRLDENGNKLESSEISLILNHRELANRNTQVLTLARKINMEE